MAKTATSKTVRMFDGETYETYKVGSKKHRAAEARRAEFDKRKAARKAWNGEAAKWARSKGVVPSGAAWKLITATADISSLSVKALKAANKADGLSLPAKKAASTKAAEVVETVTVAEVAEVTKPKGRKALRKVRSAAAKKGWETRRANAAAELEVAETVEVKAPKAGKKAAKKAKAQIAAKVDPAEVAFREALTGLFTEAEIDRAWALKSA